MEATTRVKEEKLCHPLQGAGPPAVEALSRVRRVMKVWLVRAGKAPIISWAPQRADIHQVDGWSQAAAVPPVFLRVLPSL